MSKKNLTHPAGPPLLPFPHASINAIPPAMSAKQLCDALAAAGFDSGDPLDPESLDWAFLQGDDSSRVLAWIAARLRRANVLSASDLELYDQLELEGKLLEGKDLDSAFDSISAFSETGENHEYTFLSEESLGDIRDSKLALRAEVSDLEKKLASLEWQLDLLTAHATTITQGKKSRTSAKTSATGKLARFDEELAKRSLEMNEVLGKLVATIQELSYYHSETDIGVYLSYCDFQSYIISNLACTKELNTWFTKKFEKGALRFVAKEDMPRGDFEKPHRFVVELKRINSVFAKSKKQYIEAQMEHANEEATLSKLRAQLASQHSYIHEDIHSLRRRNSELTEELKDLSLQVQECLSEDQYHLIGEAASSMIEEGSIDDRDTFLHAVRDILSSYSGSQTMTPTYVSACALVEQISELEDELHCYQHELENVLPRERGRFIDEQCRMVQILEQILSVPVTHMLPKFTPWPLAQALEELEMISYEVSASVNEVMMAREEKTKMLQQPSRNAQQERRVFADFFCHPGRLENQVRELTSRVRGIPE
ncbi:AUGMIN subunit 3 isoform X5 [Triticum aestivum]|uniref:AUGMIN subunit 3 isoform X5 n=1 Tax=Triticum aestivum TaxID=4565 RepID=UPI001D01627B|nr:AUGMIN subunit 3-like isoform X5 [Triticum aestivum]